MTNQAELREKARELFAEYFRENYPGPSTIISKPDWHAPKIFAAAFSCLKEVGLLAKQEATGSEERIWCMNCGKSVSTPVPKGTIMRAWVECPECIERKAAAPAEAEKGRAPASEEVYGSDTPCVHCKSGSIRSRLGWHYWGDGSRSKCADSPAEAPAVQRLSEEQVRRIVCLHHNRYSNVFLWAAMTADLNAALGATKGGPDDNDQI